MTILSMRDEERISRRVEEHLAEIEKVHPDLDWFCICAQGSMNYGLWDEESDVDTKMLIVPSMNDLVLNKVAINKTHIMSDGTEEHVDLKDIREYFKIMRKSNINFIEILFTDYWIVNPKYFCYWKALTSVAEWIVKINPYAMLKAVKGMAHEKLNALCHRYPSRAYYIDTFGYDGKQLSHIIRLYDFLVDYFEGGKSFKEALTSPNPDLLLDIKRHKTNYKPENAKYIAENFVNGISYFVDGYIEAHSLKNENMEDQDEFLNDVLCAIMKTGLKSELQEKGK